MDQEALLARALRAEALVERHEERWAAVRARLLELGRQAHADALEHVQYSPNERHYTAQRQAYLIAAALIVADQQRTTKHAELDALRNRAEQEGLRMVRLWSMEEKLATRRGALPTAAHRLFSAWLNRHDGGTWLASQDGRVNL